jgi:hypothetical protein
MLPYAPQQHIALDEYRLIISRDYNTRMSRNINMYISKLTVYGNFCRTSNFKVIA